MLTARGASRRELLYRFITMELIILPHHDAHRLSAQLSYIEMLFIEASP